MTDLLLTYLNAIVEKHLALHRTFTVVVSASSRSLYPNIGYKTIYEIQHVDIKLRYNR